MADVERGRPDPTRGTSTSEGRTPGVAPLEERCPLDCMVGIGYFPDEVGLPAEWTWAPERR
jgi:hypothetical protein